MKHDFKFIPQYLTDEEIMNPYVAASNFYHLYDLDSARENIGVWMNGVYNPPNWNKKCPSNFLSFYENILKLIEACWLIKKMDNTKRLANLDTMNEGESCLLSHSLYCHPLLLNYPWNYFPRSLSWKEYLNPYKVFKLFFKFRSLKEWKEALYDLLHMAFTGRNLHPIDEIVDLLGFKRHLDKLTEAVHLLYVREFEWKDGELNLKIRNSEENEKSLVEVEENTFASQDET